MIHYNIWGEPSYMGFPLTGWYPPEIKPVREGLYIVGSPKLCVMLHWNGEQWIRGNGSPLPMQDMSWCGIAYEV